jgi:Uma2 family endonuclease
MQIETTKRLFTVDEYYRMGEAGILHPEARLELIEGEIIEMSPIGDWHAACVDQTHEHFVLAIAGKAVVRGQNPVLLSNYSVPQPDVVLAKFRDDHYFNKRLSAEDTYLVVEVSDTTLAFDLKVKLALYAKAGVPEVWIEDLQNVQLLVFRNPVGSTYTTSLVLDRNSMVSPLAFPDTEFSVGDLLLSKFI